MEQKTEANKMSESNQRLIILIVGFLLVIYGFLALTNPINYPLIGTPDQTRILALFFMGIGLYLILRRRETHEH